MAVFGKVTQAIGLDIGSEVIRVAQLKPSADPILIKHGWLKTEGCLVDGEITDVEALANQVSNLFRLANISERRVILGISNQKVIVRLLTMPYMEKEDLKGAIQFQAQENIPIPVEDTILDYQVINDYTNEDNERTLQVVLVAAQKEMVQHHIAALEKAKLRPYIVDVASFALSRSLLGKEAIVPDDKELAKSTEAIGFLDIGETITNISIVQNRTPLFSRVMPMGDSTFVKAISDSLAVSLEEARKLKEEIGFSKQGAGLTDDLKKSQLEVGEKVRNILADEVLKFTNEVKRSFDYGLTENTKNDELSELLISGVGSLNKNFVSYLKESYPKVSIGDTLSAVTLAPGVQLEDTTGYAISIGLALRGLDE